MICDKLCSGPLTEYTSKQAPPPRGVLFSPAVPRRPHSSLCGLLPPPPSTSAPKKPPPPASKRRSSSSGCASGLAAASTSLAAGPGSITLAQSGSGSSRSGPWIRSKSSSRSLTFDTLSKALWTLRTPHAHDRYSWLAEDIPNGVRPIQAEMGAKKGVNIIAGIPGDGPLKRSDRAIFD